MRFFRATRLLVLAFLVLLAACGTSNNGSSIAANDASSKTLRVAFAEPIGVLNPQAFTGHFMALDMVYEPLVRYGEDGVLLPALAEAWNVSEDGLEVTFHLRQNVSFHDGTPFNSTAAKWNFERWVGEADYSFLQASVLINRIETPDEQTLIVGLSQPYEPLFSELSLTRPVRFLSPTSISDAGEFEEPVGTGAWKLVSATDTTASFELNDEYWGEKPAFDRVEVRLIPDSQTRLSALRSGEVDLLGGGYMAPVGAVEARSINETSGLVLYRGEPDTTLLLGFNPKSGHLDERAREAISLAVDTEAISTVLYGEDAVAAHGLFPSSIAYANVGDAQRYDMAAAAELLDGANLNLKMLLIGDAAHGQGDSRNAGQAIADSLSRIGVRVSIVSLDGAAYFDALLAGEYDLAFFNTYGAPYDPPGTVAAFLFSSGGEAPIWLDNQLEELVPEALGSVEETAVAAAYSQIFDHLDEIYAFVPITHPPRYYATGSRIETFVVPPTEYEFPWRELSLVR